ncbi:MAG TPA: transglycosylase domain-containing protein, partial [Verrucomicrobium sp.]|nr:transglycosylase domain-containing protein [Verrucomicrobium sp.]
MSDPEVNPIARSLMKSKSTRPSGKGGNVRRRVPIYRRGWFGALVVAMLIVGVTAFGMIMAILAPLQEQAEALDIADLQKIEVASRIMDRKGDELGKIYVQNRTPIKVDQVPMHFVQALTSAEDSRFFQHSGVD